MEKVIVGLCAGRHPMPVEEYIFREIVDFDPEVINRQAADWVEKHCGLHTAWGIGINQADDNDVRVFAGGAELVLYVTGLTMATAAVIRACAYNGVPLTLMHYDNKSGKYYPQEIF